MNPLVSIIIPAFNAETTIGGTITGALTQTVEDIEVIVVDDGSVDRTRLIAEAYGPSVTVLSKANGGVSSARNVGADAARGRYIALCDADDIMLPSYLQAALDRLADAPPDSFAYMNSYFMRMDGVAPHRVTFSGLPPAKARQRMAILQRNFCYSHLVVPREAYVAVGGSDETLVSLEDWELCMRLIFSGRVAIPVNRPHALYRWAAGSLSSDSEQMIQSELQIFNRLLQQADPLGISDDERAYVQKRLDTGSPRQLRFEADDALAEGDFHRAASLYRAAAHLTPGDLKLSARRWTAGVVPQLGRVWRARQRGADRRY